MVVVNLPGRLLFDTAWQAYYAPIVERAMAATIRVYTPGESTYDATTDTWTGSDTEHYAGKARVQPMRTARDVASTSVQSVRFQVPVNSFVARPGMQVQITASTLNPSLLSYQYVIKEVLDSSNPIEQTFECTVNAETVVS